MLHEGFFSEVKFLLGKISCRDKEASSVSDTCIPSKGLHRHWVSLSMHRKIVFSFPPSCKNISSTRRGISHSRSALSLFYLTLSMLIFSFLSFFLCKNIIFLPGLELWRGEEQAGRAACRDQSTQSVPCARVQKQDFRNAGQCLRPLYQSPEAGPQKYRSAVLTQSVPCTRVQKQDLRNTGQYS